MHGTAHITIPRFSTAVGTTAPAPLALWRVRMQVQRLAVPHEWRGYAADADQARERAMECARQQWLGFSLVITSVVQL